ncbi:MAG: class I SAM-dependent methyltransferase [Nanoarchaeota archaeon]|nr:class I SAM-dependent methyltransferase [Nanoarchaeota archaeon]
MFTTFMKLDSFNKVLDFAKTHKKVASKIIEIKSVNSKSLLDVGGGSGVLVHYLEDKFEDITILEPSDEMTNHITNPTNISIINSTIQDFSSELKYDTIVCFDSLHHFANGYENGFEEVKKGLLKMIEHANNEVIIIEPRINSFKGFSIKVQENWILRIGSYFMSIKEYEQVLEGYNYSIEKFREFYVIIIKKK